MLHFWKGTSYSSQIQMRKLEHWAICSAWLMRLVVDSDTKFCLHIPVQLVPTIIRKIDIWVSLPSIILVCQKASEGGLLFLTTRSLKYWNKWSPEYSTRTWDQFCIFSVSNWPHRNDWSAYAQLDHIIILNHFEYSQELNTLETTWNLTRELSQIKWGSLSEGLNTFSTTETYR